MCYNEILSIYALPYFGIEHFNTKDSRPVNNVVIYFLGVKMFCFNFYWKLDLEGWIIFKLGSWELSRASTELGIRFMNGIEGMNAWSARLTLLLPGGGLLQPPMNLKNNPPLDIPIGYHGIAMGLLFPYIPKKVQTSHVWRHSDVIMHDRHRNFGNFWKYRWKQMKIDFFRHKSYKYRNFYRIFGLCKKEMVLLTYTMSFKTILARNFSKFWL